MPRSVLLVVFSLIPLFQAESQQTRRVEVMKDEYIILKDPYAPPTLQSAAPYGVVEKTSISYLVKPKSKVGTSLSAASLKPTTTIVPLDDDTVTNDCAEIKKDPSVKSCEPNLVRYNDAVPNDVVWSDPNLYFPMRFHQHSEFFNGSTILDARAIFGWDHSIGSDNLVIGVIDSGINYLHPDFSGNLWNNPGETANNGVDDDDDGNGYVDDIIGIDAFNGTNDPFDCNGHGSHVAGIIGARGNNALGITGTAWRVKIITAKNAVDCGPSVSVQAVIKGMEYLWDLKANRGIPITAANGSYSGSSFSEAELAAIKLMASANILYVVAAGNDGVNIDVSPRYPAAHNAPNLITVANLNTWDPPSGAALNDSSNFGTATTEIAAPGTEIFSTVEAIGNQVERYDWKTGTSMASPFLCGAVGLLRAQRPYINSPKALMNHLFANSRTLSSISGQVKDGRVLDIQKLLTGADLTDECPNDPNKIEPGFCGCGTQDTYQNPDKDSLPNCADGCPNDAGKTSPGTCGCGVSDTDGDSDGTPDCNDGCPADGSKTSGGTCGCGVSDGDGNGNGLADCQDSSAVSAAPKAPKISRKAKSKDQIVIKMEKKDHPGLTYLIKVKIGKKTKTVTSNIPSKTIKIPIGKKVIITYHHDVNGIQSPESNGKKVTITPERR